MDTPDLWSSLRIPRSAQLALQNVIEHSDALIWVGQLNDLRLLAANEANTRFFDCSVSELLEAGSDWLKFFAPEDCDRLTAELNTLRDSPEAKAFACKLRAVSQNGKVSWLECKFMRLLFENEGQTGGDGSNVLRSATEGSTEPSFTTDTSMSEPLYIAFSYDFTALEETRSQLRQSELLYESLVENLPLNVVRKDLEGRIVFANERFSQLVECPPDELYGKTDYDLFPTELAVKYTRDDKHVVDTGATLHAEEEYQTPEGEKRYVEVLKGPVRDHDDRVIGVQVIFWDVSQRKKTEKKLRHERYLLHTLLNNLPDSIYFKNEKSEFVRVSQSLAKKFGLERAAEAIGKTDADFFAEKHAKESREQELAMMEDGQPVLDKIERETWIDGHTTWCSTSKLPLRDDAGRVVGTFGITRDITELIEIEEALARERDLLRTLMDQLPDLIYVKDQDAKFITVNRAAQKMLGAESIEDVVGKSKFDFLDREHAERHDEDDRYVLETGKPLIDREESLFDPSGKERWLLTNKVPLHDDSGKVIGLVGIDRDNTQRKQAVEALRRAKETADAANRAKSDFLANMSHEIRTPMNAIIGMTELLLDTEVKDNQREYLDMIRESGESLLTIINDILDFSKIEANKLELDKVEFNPRENLEDTMRSLALRAHDKGVEAAIRIAPDLPSRLYGDLGRLKQVVINLVGNAIKFTREGEVVLDVGILEKTDKSVLLQLVVSDTGIGIPMEKQKAIFRAFEQVDTSTTRSYGGTGLGLAISSRLAKLMGGQIRVESERDRGSKFYFTARFDLVEQSKETPVAHADEVIDARVLIVDDNATNRRILIDILTNWGMIPTECETAEEAFKLLRLANAEGSPFHIVLSDVNMPEHDGFELAAWIRDYAELSNTPVVMLTSAMRPRQLDERQRLNINSHLLKPVKQSELFDAIVTSLGGTVVAKSQPPATGENANAAGQLKILLAEDNVVNQRLALGVLGKHNHQVTVVENGRDAFEAVAGQFFDVVLMDVQMPEMDGFEATRKIREAEQGSERRIPIIAMTAHAMKGDRERCLEAGMDDYIAKPIRMNVLTEKLANHLKVFETQRNVAQSSTPASTIDWQSLEDTVQGDTELLDSVLDSFEEEAPELLSKIEQTINAQEYEKAQLSVHSLKGALQAISAQEVANVAREMEALLVTDDAEKAVDQLSNLRRDVERVLADIKHRRNS